MRAICEACSHPQPVDWQPGDLCTECGQPVRRETRCFWCARWTPAGKFCRRCGAAVVDDSLYGAARMLRDGGADRFTIPKLLVEFDPELLENFTRIYQRHAATLARHVEHVRFLEGFLHQRHWSTDLEDELIVQLPWPDEKLESLSAAVPFAPAAGDLELARRIYAGTPFPLSRSLATLVRLLLDDWEIAPEAAALVESPNAALAAEAALAVSGWRVIYGPGIPCESRALLQALRHSPFPNEAAIRLCLLGDRDAQLPPAILNPDLEFMAALVTGHLATLVAALRQDDPLRRLAAATRLIQADVYTPLADTLRAAPPEHQRKLLQQLAARKKPAPTLRDVIFPIAESTADRDIRRAAIRILCSGCPAGEVERLADAAHSDSSSYQAILQTAELAPDSLEVLGAWLLRHGAFRSEQFGMRDIAKPDRMPATFVPRYWLEADDKSRIELCRFAENQLEEYADEDLHRLLVHTAFAPGAVPVRVAVWTSLFRWYGHLDVSGRAPLMLQTAALERFFGSLPAFLQIFTGFLIDPSLRELLSQMCLYERLAHLLRYADPDILPGLAAEPRAVAAMAEALGAIARDSGFDFILRIECVRFLGWLGGVPEFRQLMHDLVTAFLGSAVDHAARTALEKF